MSALAPPGIGGFALWRFCVRSLEDPTCSTATRAFKRTSQVRAVIQRTCERARFVSSLATCYPQFIFCRVGSDTRINCQSVTGRGLLKSKSKSTAGAMPRGDDAPSGFKWVLRRRSASQVFALKHLWAIAPATLTSRPTGRLTLLKAIALTQLRLQSRREARWGFVRGLSGFLLTSPLGLS